MVDDGRGGRRRVVVANDAHRARLELIAVAGVVDVGIAEDERGSVLQDAAEDGAFGDREGGRSPILRKSLDQRAIDSELGAGDLESTSIVDAEAIAEGSAGEVRRGAIHRG